MLSWISANAGRARAALGRVRTDERGVTSIEFAIVSIPFLMLLFGIMSVCVYFFTMLYTENAVWAASRDLRTGIYQTQASGSRYAGKTGDALKTEFKKAICEKTPNQADCETNMRVMVQARTTFTSIVEPNCKNVTNNIVDDATAMAAFDAGGASSVVMVTGCFAWKFGGQLPFFKLGNLADGSFLVQASAAFRTEPYN